MPMSLWTYRARAERVIDGDTLDCVLDAGFRATREERLRLLGVNTPETKGATRLAGLVSAQFVRAWVAAADDPMHRWPLIVSTEKSDAFGRYLCRLWRQIDGACLNDDLLNAGHAVPFL